VLEIGLNRAVDLLADKPRKPRPKELGKHPNDKKPIIMKMGRWGMFLQHGKTRAALPKDIDADKLTFEEAVERINAKGGKATKKKAPKKKTKTKTKKKAPAKAKEQAEPAAEQPAD
jgi:DNA topoisomerase-1